MQVDVADLRDFYASPLGQLARRLLSRRLRRRCRPGRGETVLGLGFASPYLAAIRGDAERIGALMPAGQGALVWPSEGVVRSMLVEEERLPLADAVVARMLVVHCLEAAARERHLLREMWRVLKPEGRLLLVVPNRRGVWARLDTTPFGHGRPYSRGQIEVLLREAMFEPLDWEGALYLPPIDRRFLIRSGPAFERMGSRLTRGFGGIILVEARKELVMPAGKAVPVRARRALVLTPAAVGR
jgi:SAM-dependent methyltransferase